LARDTDAQQERASRQTIMRRMSRVVERVAELDLDDPKLRERLRLLRESARLAMSDFKFSGDVEDATWLDFARSRAAEQKRDAGLETLNRVMPAIKKIQKSGVTKTDDIAAKLNESEVPSPSGRPWTGASVRTLFARQRKLENGEG
jgi:hypothetical protein